MPTTNNEAETILKITTKYMPLHRAVGCFRELDEKVGKLSDNDSVKQSFAMFRRLAEGAMGGDGAAPHYERWRWYALFWLLWLTHMAAVLGNVASFPFAFYYGCRGWWFFAWPACFSILWVTCSNVDCTMTRWENDLRVKLEWPTISGFVGHYFVKPLRRLASGTDGLSGKGPS
jgi:hypothetical protein